MQPSEASSLLGNTPFVSIGSDIHRPSDLTNELMGEVVAGIGGGRWASQVEGVRRLAYKSPEQDQAKEALPYWMPAGVFKYRSRAGLVKHSGHVAIDLDDLGEQGTTKAIQTAVADCYCKCAFRSVRAQGVRLIFSCPPCSAEKHKAIFERVADHVRGYYGADPDPSGSDVSRASFVSFDKGIWINPDAVMLPDLATLPVRYTRTDPCVSSAEGLSEGDRETLAWGLGESRAPHEAREDGTCLTHFSLRDLARDLVVRYRKHGLPLTGPEIERAFGAWWSTAKRRGLKFRLGREDYLSELLTAIQSVRRVVWLDRVVHYWLKWTREPEFPSSAPGVERLEWAIRRHCGQTGDPHFFISARDAATITGTNFVNANLALQRLCRHGVLSKAGKRLHARHAQEYLLR